MWEMCSCVTSSRSATMTCGLGHRGYEVVADSLLMLEELGRDHRTDGVASPVLGTGATAAVSVETGEGICSAWLQLPTQHVAIGHRTSAALLASRAMHRGTRVTGVLPA